MNGMELIRHRRSVRTFDGNVLRSNDAEKVMEFAAAVENPYGISIEWRLMSAAAEGLSSPVISGTDTWIAGKSARVPHAEEAFGYSFEKIVLFAESLGLGTTWIAGTMDRPAFERAMELKPGEVMPCVSPLGYPAEKKSLRETLMRKGVGADKRMKFEDLFFDGSFDKPLSEAAGGILTDPLVMVQWAPSAVNKQPWRVVVDGKNVHFYEKHSRGYLGADGWDLQKIDLGIALCHFEYGLAEKNLEASFVMEDPAVRTLADVSYIASYLLKN